MVAVTAIGLVSPVGYDAVASCAAVRAGVVRAGELASIGAVDPTTAEEAPVSGHAVHGLTEGFVKVGRLVRLGVAALDDLIEDQPPEALGGAGLFVNFSSGYHAAELARLAEQWARDDPPVLVDPELLFDEEARRSIFRDTLTQALLRLGRLDVPEADRHVYFGDETGFVAALRDAAAALETGRYERCVVGGIDSYVEPDFLRVLLALGLLKTPQNPAGFAPGEAAGFALLEREEVARARGAELLGRIEGVASEREPFHRCSGDAPTGRALAAALTLAHGESEGGARFVITNLNGDEYRARDWGAALVQLAGTLDLEAGAGLHPAVSFGQIGAAAGPASTAVALRAFARGYTPEPSALIWLASDAGERCAFRVERAA